MPDGRRGTIFLSRLRQNSERGNNANNAKEVFEKQWRTFE
jgi:hypothetical protein